VISITVFGSAPLQVGLKSSFVSADVEVFSAVDLRDVILSAGLGKGQAPVYVEQNDEIVFSASPSWRERAHSAVIGDVSYTFPHPIDILVAKISRLEPKVLLAFHLVLDETGHPTPDELILALQRHIDLYRPAFDEENSGDPYANTRIVWRELDQADIDVRTAIIILAIRRRHAGYGGAVPDYRKLLDAQRA